MHGNIHILKHKFMILAHCQIHFSLWDFRTFMHARHKYLFNMWFMLLWNKIYYHLHRAFLRAKCLHPLRLNLASSIFPLLFSTFSVSVLTLFAQLCVLKVFSNFSPKLQSCLLRDKCTSTSLYGLDRASLFACGCPVTYTLLFDKLVFLHGILLFPLKYQPHGPSAMA